MHKITEASEKESQRPFCCQAGKSSREKDWEKNRESPLNLMGHRRAPAKNKPDYTVQREGGSLRPSEKCLRQNLGGQAGESRPRLEIGLSGHPSEVSCTSNANMAGSNGSERS